MTLSLFRLCATNKNEDEGRKGKADENGAGRLVPPAVVCRRRSAVVFLIGLSVLSAAENGNVAEKLPPAVEAEKVLPAVETEDDGYLQKALEQDELDDDNLFRLEDAVVRSEPDAPQPPENDWEKRWLISTRLSFRLRLSMILRRKTAGRRH